jgi:hypothetical protein
MDNKNEDIDFNKEVSINVDDIKPMKSSSFDASKYDGMKVKIESYEIKSETNFFPDGKNFDKNSKEKMYRIYVYTEPLREFDKDGKLTDKIIEYEKDGVKKQIRVHSRFNLITGPDGKPGFATGAKAKFNAFLKKHKCEKISDLKGKEVLLTTEASKVEGDDSVFLRIV